MYESWTYLEAWNFTSIGTLMIKTTFVFVLVYWTAASLEHQTRLIWRTNSSWPPTWRWLKSIDQLPGWENPNTCHQVRFWFSNFKPYEIQDFWLWRFNKFNYLGFRYSSGNSNQKCPNRKKIGICSSFTFNFFSFFKSIVKDSVMRIQGLFSSFFKILQ